MTERESAPGAEVDLDGTPVEAVKAVWAAALGLATVDADEGFFDLGASSATVVEVVRILRRRWPRIRVVHVFAHPTVAQLVAFLEGA
ncbi:MAG: acyl carrier protein [Frankiaceae bacterium]